MQLMSNEKNIIYTITCSYYKTKSENIQMNLYIEDNNTVSAVNILPSSIFFKLKIILLFVCVSWILSSILFWCQWHILVIVRPEVCISFRFLLFITFIFTLVFKYNEGILLISKSGSYSLIHMLYPSNLFTAFFKSAHLCCNNMKYGYFIGFKILSISRVYKLYNFLNWRELVRAVYRHFRDLEFAARFQM